MRDERGRNHLALFCTKAITAVGSVLGKGRCKMGRCLLGLACVGGRWMCLWGGGVEPPWHLELSSVPGGRRGRSECFSALQPLWNILNSHVNSTRVCLVPITPRKGVLHVRYRSIAARITRSSRDRRFTKPMASRWSADRDQRESTGSLPSAPSTKPAADRPISSRHD